MSTFKYTIHCEPMIEHISASVGGGEHDPRIISARELLARRNWYNLRYRKTHDDGAFEFEGSKDEIDGTRTAIFKYHPGDEGEQGVIEMLESDDASSDSSNSVDTAPVGTVATPAGTAPRPDAGPAATPAARPDAVGVAPDEAAFDAMRAQLEAARRENEAEHARTLARATAERDAFKEQNTALLRAFGIRYGSGAQEVLEATMRACPLSGTPEQIAENQRIINAVIDRKNSLYASGARISKEGVPALVNTIRNEQKLKWWERFGLGKALLGSVFSGSAGALGSLAVFGCLAAPLVAAGATAGAAFALVKRRLERSNALGKGKTFLHRNPGATAAVFSVVSGLGAGAHMPDGSAYMGAFVEKLADGSKEGVGKILQLFARLRMPF